MARRAKTVTPPSASGGRKRSRRASTALLITIAVAVSALTMVGLSAQAIAAHASCTNNPVLLNVDVTADLSPVVSSVAREFNEQDHTARGRCAQVEVSQTAAAQDSATVAGQIDGQASSKGVPAPDAWIPDSSLWVDVARSTPLGAQAIRPTGIEVAHSPLMIVMPKAVARETHAFNTPVSWRILLPAADGGPPAAEGLRVDLPDPTASAAGLATLVQLSRLLGPGASARASFTKFVLSSEASSQFVTPSDLASFVSTASPPFDSRSVTVTSEQAVIAYDRANPGNPLAAQYPSSPAASARTAGSSAHSQFGSPDLDYPYLLTTSNPTELAAAREFGQELRQPYAQALVRYDGFRAADGTTDATPSSFGLSTQVLQQAPSATPSEAQTTLQVWNKLQQGSRDLVLIDVSSAMAQPDGNGSQTLEQELTATAVLGLALFPDSTQMGEWQVADNISGHKPYEQLVSVGPLPGDIGVISRRSQLQQIDATLHPSNSGLALNDAILAAYKQMLATYKPDKSNAVIVLTSGVDTPGDMSTPSLLAHLRKLFNPNRKVEVVPLMVGTAGNFRGLQQVASITGGAAFDITQPSQVARAFIEGFSRRLCDPHCAAP
jgi:Bacterial extracellular solute-binding protein